VSITEVSVRTSDSAGGPADEQPLTDEERKMVARLLADPIVFPQTFKAWLIAFLEGSDLTLPINSILGLNSFLSPSGGGGSAGIMGALPAGLIFPFAGPTPPAGTLFCDGRVVPSTTYPRLYKAIGNTYGGDANSFVLPDIQGRMIVGTGPGHGINENDNRAPINRGPRHHHYMDMYTDNGGYHGHAYVRATERVTSGFAGGGNVFNWPNSEETQGTSGEGEHQHHLNGNTSGGGDQDTSAYICLPYIINY